jgi:hypothetical protein
MGIRHYEEWLDARKDGTMNNGNNRDRHEWRSVKPPSVAPWRFLQIGGPNGRSHPTARFLSCFRDESQNRSPERLCPSPQRCFGRKSLNGPPFGTGTNGMKISDKSL